MDWSIQIIAACVGFVAFVPITLTIMAIADWYDTWQRRRRLPLARCPTCGVYSRQRFDFQEPRDRGATDVSRQK